MSQLRLPLRLAVFASGRGSNLRAIHTYLRGLPTPAPASVELCVGGKASSPVFEYCHQQNIPVCWFAKDTYTTPAELGVAMLKTLADYRIDLIALAGYMQRIPPAVIACYRGRILNIHPALLPLFGGTGMYGMHVHRAVLQAGNTESGATVHLADEDYDTGPILAQERVPVLPGDTPEILAERVLELEHTLYPQVLAAYALKLFDEQNMEQDHV